MRSVYVDSDQSSQWNRLVIFFMAYVIVFGSLLSSPSAGATRPIIIIPGVYEEYQYTHNPNIDTDYFTQLGAFEHQSGITADNFRIVDTPLFFSLMDGETFIYRLAAGLAFGIRAGNIPTVIYDTTDGASEFIVNFNKKILELSIVDFHGGIEGKIFLFSHYIGSLIPPMRNTFFNYIRPILADTVVPEGVAEPIYELYKVELLNGISKQPGVEILDFLRRLAEDETQLHAVRQRAREIVK